VLVYWEYKEWQEVSLRVGARGGWSRRMEDTSASSPTSAAAIFATAFSYVTWGEITNIKLTK